MKFSELVHAFKVQQRTLKPYKSAISRLPKHTPPRENLLLTNACVMRSSFKHCLVCTALIKQLNKILKSTELHLKRLWVKMQKTSQNSVQNVSHFNTTVSVVSF